MIDLRLQIDFEDKTIKVYKDPNCDLSEVIISNSFYTIPFAQAIGKTCNDIVNWFKEAGE